MSTKLGCETHPCIGLGNNRGSHDQSRVTYEIIVLRMHGRHWKVLDSTNLPVGRQGLRVEGPSV
jgi:hypothetical protein